MSLELRPVPQLIHALHLSPQIRLSLHLLQLPLLKLKEYLIEEIEKNPLLEFMDSPPPYPKEKITLSWSEEDEEKKYRQSLITQPPTLQEHLLRQLRLFTDIEQDLKIGEAIIGNIDDDGYLRVPIEDIAESCKITKSKVENVLNLIQTFDPAGIGARDLRECLLLQLKEKGKENSLAGHIVDQYLLFLEKRRYGYIAKKLSTRDEKVSVDNVKETLKEITRLEPRPGYFFSTKENPHLIPDAILEKNENGFEVILNEEELPLLIINEKYKNLLRQKETPAETREFLKERFKAAGALIDAVNKRKKTIKKIIESIVSIQNDFFDKGQEKFRPMTLDELAKTIGKHKSTVSRAMANKYLQTPQGILGLRYFLSSGIRQKDGNILSSKNIKLKISELIENEDKRKPLSDQEILNLLNQEGLSLSRRAVTKYRQQLKILPSLSRRE